MYFNSSARDNPYSGENIILHTTDSIQKPGSMKWKTWQNWNA